MHKNLRVTAVLVILTFCSFGFWNCSRSGRGGGAGGGTGATGTGSGNYSLSVAPIPVAAGTEQTFCVTLKLNNADPIFVRRIRLQSDAGIVQTVVYKSTATSEVPSPGTPCTPMGALSANRPILIGLNADTDLVFPTAAAGPVGLELSANQMLQFEVHFYNPSASPVNAGVTLTMESTAVPVNAVHANISLGGTIGINIPAGSSTSVAGGFMPSAPNSFLFAVQPQQWRFGTGMKFYAATSAADTSNLIYQDTAGFAAPLKTFATPVDMNGKGFKYECTYNNTGSLTLTFGESVVTDETCMAWQYYYPSIGFNVCVDSTCYTL